ncbi:MAG: galactose-1-phosphate uridylyltransferase [Ktedonobacterales bacterium]
MSENADHEEHAGGRLVENPLLGEVVVQTPGRMNRREGTSECPFCADRQMGRWPSGQETWARPNDFPALEPPLGECLVLLYAREHNLSFPELSLEQACAVVDLWQAVYADLSRSYVCVMTFENSGAAIGQTQTHPHGQTYGVSFLPPVISREREHFRAARLATGHCLGCDLTRSELAGPRLVLSTPHWTGFVPEYARYPYEVHLYARDHVGTVSDLPRGGAAAVELAGVLLSLVRAENQVYTAPMPYMLVVHQLAEPDFHLHLELLPVGRSPGKLKYAASVETGFGLWLNDSLPEEKAAELRAAIGSIGELR